MLICTSISKVNLIFSRFFAILINLPLLCFADIINFDMFKRSIRSHCICDFVIYKATFENLFAFKKGEKESLVFDTLENNSILRSNHRKCLKFCYPNNVCIEYTAQLQQLKIETHRLQTVLKEIKKMMTHAVCCRCDVVSATDAVCCMLKINKWTNNLRTKSVWEVGVLPVLWLEKAENITLLTKVYQFANISK